MQSLRDKLIAAGLITASPEAPPRPESTESAKAEVTYAPGSREASRAASRAQLLLARKVLELASAHEVALEPGATVFHFVTRKNKLRRLELSEGQAAKLESGELAIIERPEPDRIEHSLVPKAIALDVHALSPVAVRFLNANDVQVGFRGEQRDGAVAALVAQPMAEQSAPTPQPPPEPASPPTSAAPATEKFITIRRSPRAKQPGSDSP